jgi:hypothetical protein
MVASVTGDGGKTDPMAPAVRTQNDPWLFGRVPDLLLGAGLGYLLTLPLLFFLSEAAALATAGLEKTGASSLQRAHHSA